MKLSVDLSTAWVKCLSIICLGFEYYGYDNRDSDFGVQAKDLKGKTSQAKSTFSIVTHMYRPFSHIPKKHLLPTNAKHYLVDFQTAYKMMSQPSSPAS